MDPQSQQRFSWQVPRPSQRFVSGELQFARVDPEAAWRLKDKLQNLSNARV